MDIGLLNLRLSGWKLIFRPAGSNDPGRGTSGPPCARGSTKKLSEDNPVSLNNWFNVYFTLSVFDTSSLVISAHCNIFHEKRVTRSETYPQSLSPTNAPTYLVCMVKGQLFVGLTRILRRYWSTDHVETPKVRSTSMQASMSTGVKRRCMSSGRSNRAFLTPSCSLMFLQFFD